jgi:hypothetical protein
MTRVEIIRTKFAAKHTSSATICGTCINRINGVCSVNECVYGIVGYHFTGCEGEYYEEKGELHERDGYHVPKSHICPDDCAF